MHVTTFTDYTLRVLIYLAVHDREKTTADKIAKSNNISFHHVAKTAQWLAREGYINSERGRSGGITLKRPIADINIGEIIRATEASTALVDCMRANGGTCCIKPACGLKSVLAEAQEAFFTVLQNYNLADVIIQKSALNRLLASVE